MEKKLKDVFKPTPIKEDVLNLTVFIQHTASYTKPACWPSNVIHDSTYAKLACTYMLCIA